MRKVILATPSMDGRVEGTFAYSLAETVRLGMTQGVYFQPLIVMHDALVEQIRDDAFAMAYAYPDTEVIWIDSDVSWAPEQALRLLSHSVDVVGGTYRRKEDVETYVCKCHPDLYAVGTNGLAEVDALGCGFLYLSRRAMDYLWMTSRPYKTKTGDARRWIFDSQLIDGKRVSEDVLMCAKLRAGGFKVHLDPKITCAHKGPKIWTGDFESWMQRFQEERAQAA